MRSRDRKRAAVAVALLVVVACGGESSATRPSRSVAVPTSANSADLRLARDAARRRLEALVAGRSEPPPLIVGWDQIESGVLLNRQQQDAFCQALDAPHVDDALASLVRAGWNALSVRLRRKPLSDEAETVMQIAATFATKSCPLWKPAVDPPAPPGTTPPAWYPTGYRIVIGEPDLVWRWSDRGSFQCGEGVKRCWQIKVLARVGCPRVAGVLSIKDVEGAVVGIDQRWVIGVRAAEPTALGFGTTVAAAAKAELISLTCT